MMAIVEGIPTLLHVAVVLFILGLIQFLFSVNLAVAGAVLGVFLPFMLLYCGMTMLQIIWVECPYRTPFSLLIRYVVIWAMNLISKILRKIFRATHIFCLRLWSARLYRFARAYDFEKKAVELSLEAEIGRAHV